MPAKKEAFFYFLFNVNLTLRYPLVKITGLALLSLLQY